MKSSLCLSACSLVLASLTSLPAAHTAETGPTDKDPSTLFAVRQQPELESWRAEGAKDLETAVHNLDELEKPTGAAKAVVVFAKVGQTHVALLRAARAAAKLLIWSEIAGVDLDFRVEAARNRLSAVIDRLSTAPEIKVRINADMQNFGTLLKRVSKERINKVLNAERSQNWEEADKALFEIREMFEPTIVWHRYTELQSDMKPYDLKAGEIKIPRDAARRKLAATELSALAKQATPDFATITTRIAEAVKSIGATGQAAINKDSVAGPQAMLELVALWQATDAAVLRARALDWARLEVDDQARAELTQLDSGYAQFVQTIHDQLVAMIVADGARLAPAEVEPRYKAWVEAAGAAAAATPHPASAATSVTFRKSLSDALDRLAAKSPAIDTEVKQYRRATDDLLRWRERTVQSYLRYHAGEWPSLEKRLRAAAGPEEKSPGLLPQRDDGAVELLAAAPVVIPHLAQKMVGTPAIVRDVFLLPTAADSKNANPVVAMSVYDRRVYAELTSMPDMQAAAAELRAELGLANLAPGASPEALTLDAAEALLSIDLGAVESVGGKVTGLELEGLIPRMAAVSPTDLLARPDSLPPETFTKASSQLVVRFTLDPAWAAGRYFIAIRPQ